MAQPQFQKSFNSGEWSPNLYSRVDIEKYHSGAALLENFFVDYRGGASTRPGSKYILQAYKSATPVRLIPFQASFNISYILEFGDGYIRFFNQSAPILESNHAITGATQANPCVLSVTNTYSVGDWVFVSNVGGMTQLNGNYYSILARTAGSITLGDLNGNPIDSTTFGAYTSGGRTARVYTIASPYAAADLALLKFAQNINALILTHPSYAPASLTLIASNNWLLANINFGTTASIPQNIVTSTTLTSGTVNYSYVVTSVDALGDESVASQPANGLVSLQDLRTTPGSNSISWDPVSGAVSYNVYKSDVSYFGVVPAGVPYGFIGNVTGNQIIDSNITPDFSQTPPIGQNPFQGSSVASITQTAAGTYLTVPSVIFTGGSPTAPAVASAVLGVQGTPIINVGGTGYAIGDLITLTQGVVVRVAAIGGGGAITTFSAITASGCNPGAVTAGPVPANPVAQTSTTGAGSGATINLVWGVQQTIVINGGAGYQSVPAVTYFHANGASATAVLTGASTVFPAVPGFFQQRLALCAADASPETLNFSQPGSYYNFNTSSPIQPDDAISVTLASGQLETIKSLLPTAPGLIVFTDKSSWLVNGGALGSAISPSQIVANHQSANGANDMPPILNNFDILYVESKGSIVRDSTYNYYAQVFTGTDISVIASHLFFGFQLMEWAWAQEPFKLVWAVRNDGVMLTLTFAKEQEFIAWSHHVTNGFYKSVATVVESTTTLGFVDAVYTVVERNITGVSNVQFIERFDDRYLGGQMSNSWCVDAGVQYNGPPTLSFSGASHLGGHIVIATATDNLGNTTVIPAFTMPLSGNFTLAAPTPVGATGYVRVTVGIYFLCQLQTLAIDTGEPTIQGKEKKINAVTVRCVDTIGLQLGSTFNNLVYMKDLILGNVGSMTNQKVTDLVTGDARTYLDPSYTTPGQYCIQQPFPFPATITGVIPQLAVGDTR